MYYIMFLSDCFGCSSSQPVVIGITFARLLGWRTKSNWTLSTRRLFWMLFCPSFPMLSWVLWSPAPALWWPLCPGLTYHSLYSIILRRWTASSPINASHFRETPFSTMYSYPPYLWCISYSFPIFDVYLIPLPELWCISYPLSRSLMYVISLILDVYYIPFPHFGKSALNFGIAMLSYDEIMLISVC